jgi:hypothetical protein
MLVTGCRVVTNLVFNALMQNKTRFHTGLARIPNYFRIE